MTQGDGSIVSTSLSYLTQGDGSIVSTSLSYLTSQTDYTGNITRFTYDGLGRQITELCTIDTALQSQVKKYYDGNGNVVKEKVRNNTAYANATFRETNYEYDIMNRLSKVTDGEGNSTAYAYNVFGNVSRMYTGLTPSTQITSAYNPETSPYGLVMYTYDSLGRLEQMIDAESNTESYTYCFNGQVKTKTDKNGVVTSYTYDPFGRVTSKTANGESVSYTYDKLGNVKTMVDGEGTTTYDYDNFYRLKTETRGDTVKNYSYDKSGNTSAFSLAKSGNVLQSATYTYDNLNRLTAYSSEGVTASYEYDKNGAVLKAVLPGETVDYTYNKGGLVTSIKSSGGDSISYEYFADGNVKTYTLRGIRKQYEYDNSGRLVKETSGNNADTYTYDAFGNRVSQNHTSSAGNFTVTNAFNKNNQQIKTIKKQGENETLTNYSYDDNGNLLLTSISSLLPETGDEPGLFLSETPNGLVNITENTFDVFGRLTSVKTSENGEVTEASYTYDGNGIRQTKTVDGTTIAHLWDGGNMVAEISNGAVTLYHRANSLIARQKGKNVDTYRLNAHGDVIALGAVKYDYDAFGNQIKETTDDVNPFRYCAEYFDNETGQIYLRARYYEPATSRMLSEDPAKQGLNWYVYCSNNPVNRIDPSGLKDYVYTSQTDYYVENDWGFWEFLNTDRYYAEIGGSRYQANSKETVTLYDWNSFDTDFLNGTLDSLVSTANTKTTNAKRILSQSVGGDLDFKLQMDKEKLYLANGILYNRNEAGNFVWAYFLESQNYSGYISGALAQGGSIISPMINMNGLPRLDEEWDRQARWSGVKYYYDRNNSWWVYYLLYGGRPKY